MYIHIFQVGLDSRPVMREAYVLFKDGGDPEKVFFIRSSGLYVQIAFVTSLQIFLDISHAIFF